MTGVLTSSLTFWIAIGILLFWAVGACNRLVRLRAAALRAFGVLDARLLDMIAMLHACEAQPSAAASQFGISLAAARSHPLRGASLAALSAVRDMLYSAWEQGACERSPLQLQQWDVLMVQNRQASQLFNEAAMPYNAAISQFPTLLLSRLFGFKPVRLL